MTKKNGKANDLDIFSHRDKKRVASVTRGCVCGFLMFLGSMSLEAQQYLCIAQQPGVASYAIPADGSTPGDPLPVPLVITTASPAQGLATSAVGSSQLLYVSTSNGDLSAYTISQGSSNVSLELEWTVSLNLSDPNPSTVFSQISIATLGGVQYLYAISGNDSNLYWCTLKGDSPPSAVQSVSLSSPPDSQTSSMTIVEVGGSQYLYVNFENSGAPANFVIAYPINNDGTIGSSVWTLLLSSEGASAMTSATVSGIQYLYVWLDDSGELYGYTINPGSSAPSAASWTSVTVPKPAVTYLNVNQLASGQYMYIASGDSAVGGSVLSSTPIQSDGDPVGFGQWNPAPAVQSYNSPPGSSFVIEPGVNPPPAPTPSPSPNSPGPISGGQTKQKFGVASNRVNKLCWAYDSSIVSYQLYRNGVLIAVLAGDVTSYTDYDQPKNAEVYKLKKFNALGQSYSVKISVGG